MHKTKWDRIYTEKQQQQNHFFTPLIYVLKSQKQNHAYRGWKVATTVPVLDHSEFGVTE
jgi:hypothetical protein